MRPKLALFGVVLQVGALVYLAADRELLVRTGRTVYLRTKPVDPRDVFRGDYVRLDYEISSLPSRFWRDGLRPPEGAGKADPPPAKPGTRVFVGLSLDETGVAHPEFVSDRRPVGGLFLKGTASSSWGSRLAVVYGLEAYFVEQGKGLELERGQARPDRIRVPLEMETAVRSDGSAVLKGYRWCPLGIGLEVQTQPGSLDRRMRPLTARLSLYNASDRPVAVVDLPGGRSFALEPEEWRGGGESGWRWVGENRPLPAVRDEDVRVLAPGETCAVSLSFRDPEWFVQEEGKAPQSLAEADVGWSARFRFVYRPPSAAESAGLQQAALLWHGRLHSSAFGGGFVD